MDELTNKMIKELMGMDTLAGTAEAIAVAMMNLKVNGLFTRARLSDNPDENIEFCYQIAEMLRGEKRRSNDT